MKHLMEEAQAYVRNFGFSVIPLHPNAKVSWLQYRLEEFQRRLPTEEEIRQWWDNSLGLGIGIVCGKVSNLVVLNINDVDRFAEFLKSHGLSLPETPRVKTKRGVHVYFRYPAHRVVERHPHDDAGAELLGDGCYVVAPPTTIDDYEYRWAHRGGRWMRPDEVSLAEIPEELLDLFHVPLATDTQSEREDSEHVEVFEDDAPAEEQLKERHTFPAAAGSSRVSRLPMTTESGSFERPLDRVIAKLEEHGCKPTRRKALCPAHDDRNPSLSLNETEDGTVLLKCHRGCATEDVLKRLGLSWSDLFPPQRRRHNNSQPQHKKLDDPLTWWAEHCGVPREWLQKLPLKAWEGAVAFTWPYIETVKLRGPERKGWWYPIGGKCPPLWPALPDPAPQILVLCEGESDATVALYCVDALNLQQKVTVAAVTKGAATRPGVFEMRELRAYGVTGLLLVPDADEDGEKWATAWRETARKVGLRAHCLDLVAKKLISPLSGEKDLRDAFRRHPPGVLREMQAAIKDLVGQESLVGTIGEAVPTELRTPAKSQESSVGTIGDTVPTKLRTLAHILSSPAAESLTSLPFLGHKGVVIQGWGHLLAAPPKCGKTEVIWACAQEWDTQGLRVLWVTEETESVWSARIRRDAVSQANIHWLMAAGMRAEEILEAIREAAPTFDVVIVDTLRHLFQVDEGDNALIARTIAELDAAIGRDKTRLYLHHTRKAPGQHGERTAGGLAFVGGVDRQLELSWDEHDDSRRRLKGVSRICPVPELLLAWEEGRLRALGDPKDVELSQVRERVLEVLSDEDTWRTTAEVMALLGEPRPSDRLVRAALRDLALRGIIERDPPISQGEARGRTHRWRPAKFSWNGECISSNQTSDGLPEEMVWLY